MISSLSLYVLSPRLNLQLTDDKLRITVWQLKHHLYVLLTTHSCSKIKLQRKKISQGAALEKRSPKEYFKLTHTHVVGSILSPIPSAKITAIQNWGLNKNVIFRKINVGFNCRCNCCFGIISTLALS